MYRSPKQLSAVENVKTIYMWNTALSSKTLLSNALSSNGTFGRMEHWSNGRLVERNIGRMEHWSNGTLVERNIRLTEHSSNLT